MTDDDPMARLLRAAGPRPAVPLETAARVKSVLRSHWRAEVQAVRRRRTSLWAVSSVAAAVALIVMIGRGQWGPDAKPSGKAEPVATLQRSEGSVRGQDGAPLRIGDGLTPGSEIATGIDGRAALALAAGTSVRLDTDSWVLLTTGSILDLKRGAVYIDSGARQARSSPVMVRTELGIVRDVGTQFEVRIQDGGLQVSVREGIAHLSRGGRPFQVEAGTRLLVRAEGAVETRALPVQGPDWDWVLAIAPAFSLEGRTLGDYLDWVSRETGWRVQFADPSISQAAPREILHGSIEGLRPDETPAAVLPACGLRHHLTGGTLIIEHPEGSGRHDSH